MTKGLPDWIAVDWGTSNLRVWAMSGGTVLDAADSADGMGKLDPSGFEPALLNLIGPWIGTSKCTAIACGMVGARQGWIEAAYGAVPCPPLSPALTRAPVQHPMLDLWIVPGLSQQNPADVMRGEETQIAGYLHENPNWDGVICLPGTHSKWVHVSAGEVVSFQTFMTGEMFAALSQHTVLRHSIASDGWDEAAFDTALANTLSRPEQLASRLFSLRAQDLLHAQSPATARAALSGLLIGAELAASRPYWLGQQIAIIGSDDTARLYQRALASQGVTPQMANARDMTLSGLKAAHILLET